MAAPAQRRLQGLLAQLGEVGLGPGRCAAAPGSDVSSSLRPGPDVVDVDAITVEAIPSCTGGAVVRGVHLNDLTDAAWAKLHAAFLEYGFLVLPEQHGLTLEAEKAFGERFGSLEFTGSALTNMKKARDGKGSVEWEGKLFYTVAEDEETFKVNRLNEGWHTDSTYMPQSSKVAMLYAQVVPPSGGGGTEFCDMRHAYENLDAATKEKIETLAAYHSTQYSLLRRSGHMLGFKVGEVQSPSWVPKPIQHPRMSENNTYLRPLVKVHPETGRKSLFLASHAFGLAGMTELESEKLLDDLAAFAAQEPRTYLHNWSPGDLVVWDNRCFMHRARPSVDLMEPRRLRGTRVAGDVPTESGLPNTDAVEKFWTAVQHVRETKAWETADERAR